MNKMEPMNTLNERLQYLMDTQPGGPTSPTKLAADSGVSQPNISRIVSGETQDPRRSTLVKLTNALGGNIDWLINGKGEPYAKSDNVVRLQNSNNSLTFLTGGASDFTLVPVLDSHFYIEGGVIKMSGMPTRFAPFFGPNSARVAAAPVKDNSMLGYERMSLVKGGLAFIDPTIEPEPDSVVAAKLGEGTLFGIYSLFGNKATLTSFATKSSQEIDPSKIIGVVVGAYQGPY